MGKKYSFLLVAFVLLIPFTAPTSVRGAGFAIYEGSARGNALGGTLVGRADDPSALFYNPAGMTQLPGSQVAGGATAIIPTTDVVTHQGGTQITTETTANVWTPPHLYSTCQLTDSIWLGLGVFSRFGLGTEFDPNWPGRYNTYEAVIQTLSVNPNVAFKLGDRLSLAFGVSLMWMNLTLNQKIDFPNLYNPDPDTYGNDIDQSLTGDSSGCGYNLAFHFKPWNWMSLGALYRSKVKQEIKGEVDFTKPPSVEAAYPTVFNDTTASGEIMFPDMVFLGATFFPSDRLSLEVGGTWTGWSTYEKLTIHYGAPLLNPIKPGVTSSTKDKRWNDTWRFHVGVEYRVNDWMDLRLGYVRDISPIPDDTVDYLVPTSDRDLYSAGFGLRHGKWSFDLSYTFLHFESRAVGARPSEGIWDSTFEHGFAHLFGFSVGYCF